MHSSAPINRESLKCFLACSFKLALIAVFLIRLFLPDLARASTTITLDEALGLAQKNSDSLKSIDLTVQSLEAEVRSRDLELSANLVGDASHIRDRRQALSGTPPSSYSLLDLNLSKLFSTGTQVSILTGTQIFDADATPPSRTLATLQATLTQELWRNSFGRATRLRREADSFELKSRRFDSTYKKQLVLISIENTYWDLSSALKEEQIRLDNIKRGQALEKWIRDRVRRSAAESSDLLQVQALVAQRQLELLTTRSRLEQLRNQVRQLIPGSAPESWQLDLASLEVSRDPRSLTALSNFGNNLEDSQGATPEPIRLDSLASEYSARQLKAVALKTDDGLKPVLEAYVSHGRNGLDTGFGSSWGEAVGPSFTSTQVGLRFSMDLDADLKGERRISANLNAESQFSQARALARESSVGWEQLERQVRDLKLQITQARTLAEVQNRKSKEERRRYDQGRSTAFQVITFEVDAAQSEVQLYAIFAALRKVEAQARAYALENGFKGRNS